MIRIKALILAAGYATRLYPLTEDTPKQLLEVAGKPIIEHIMAHLEEMEEITEILIVTNHRYHHQFRIWLNHFEFPKKIKLINDGTINNDDRLGAVGDINFVLKEEEIDGNLLVIAGDNLFGFSLQNFVDFFQEQKKSVVAFYNMKDLDKVRGKYGVGVLEGSNVVGFEEKPLNPSSALASTACYVFTKEDLSVVESLVAQNKVDNPGDLVRWLVRKSEVGGFVFDEHWFDIGSPESLEEAKKLYCRDS